MPKDSKDSRSRYEPYSLNERKTVCACCHFAKYANSDPELQSDITISEYVEQNWPNCPCGVEHCSTYRIFLPTFHRFGDIPVKQYFCSGRNPDFSHLNWSDQRIHQSARKNLNQSKHRQVRETNLLEAVDEIFSQNKQIDQLQQQILTLQGEIQMRDYHIQQLICQFPISPVPDWS